MGIDLSAFYIYDFTIGVKENILKDGCLNDYYTWRKFDDICKIEIPKLVLMGLTVIFMNDYNFDSSNLNELISDYIWQDDGSVSDDLYLLIKNRIEELEYQNDEMLELLEKEIKIELK